MFSPTAAPDWTRNAENAERFWNALERFEKRKDAQIALPLDIALPCEMTLQQQIWLAQDYIRIFTRQGYVVLGGIHPPDHDERNWHLHLLISLRKIDAHGFAHTKAEQQENYRDRKGYVNGLRDKWEKIANHHLARHGIDARIDRRSLQEQGIDRAPQRHRGPSEAAVVFLEQDKKARAAAVAEIDSLKAQVIDLDAKRAERAAQPEQQPLRPCGAEKNLEMRQGDEITAQKATTMQTPDSGPSPANQNHLDDLEAERLDRLHFGDAKERGAARPAPPDFGRAAFDATEADAALREAWRQPAFSASTIEADPWTAVYLPIPPTPDAALLRKGLEAVAECQEMPGEGPGTGPRLGQGESHGPAENAHAATERLHELAQYIETMLRVREPFEERQAPFSQAEPSAGRYDELKPEPEAPRPPPSAAAVEKAAAEAVEAQGGQAAPAAPAEAITPTGEPQRAAEPRNFPDPLASFEADALTFFGRAERTAGNLLSSAAALFEGFISGLGNVLASPFRPTELEREVAPKVAEERAQEAAVGEAYRNYLAEYDERHTAQIQAQQTRDLNSTLGYDHDGQSHEPE
jgi:hypothetical protein